MATDTQDLRTRLEKLERANRRMRGVELVMLALVLVSCGIGATHSRMIEAERFVLKDANGKLQGAMFVGPDGPALEFYDGNQKLRVRLSVFHDMPNLTLHSSKDNAASVALAVVPTGADLKGPETAGLMLNFDGRPRAQLDVSIEGPRLFLKDENGYSATVGSYYSTAHPGRKFSAASVVLQKDLGVIWHTP